MNHREIGKRGRGSDLGDVLPHELSVQAARGDRDAGRSGASVGAVAVGDALRKAAGDKRERWVGVNGPAAKEGLAGGERGPHEGRCKRQTGGVQPR